jgi:hypothetical protein
MPEGVKDRYLLKGAQGRLAIIEAQRKISRTIMALLHGKLNGRRRNWPPS